MNARELALFCGAACCVIAFFVLLATATSATTTSGGGGSICWRKRCASPTRPRRAFTRSASAAAAGLDRSGVAIYPLRNPAKR